MMLLAPLIALALIAADAPPSTPKPDPGTAWNLSLPEAIRLGLTRSEVVRVVATETKGVPPAGYTTWNASVANLPIGFNSLHARDVPPPAASPHALDLVIAQASADLAVEPFKSALLAHVRSIEQQYWALALARATVENRETAVRLGRKILDREKSFTEFSRGEGADMAAAEQQLEDFKLSLVTATADLVTTERQLRNILGLPAGDDRRIVAWTPALEAKVEPNWETSLQMMLAFQPDVVAQRNLLADAALEEALPLVGDAGTDPLRAKSPQQRERQQEFFRQILHQTTHSLSRFTLEIDANYKEFETARRAKAATAKRLAALRAFYDEGRVTVDRLLDAVSQDANATARETLFKMSYNTSIAALEEARGTLLDVHGVTIALPLRSQATANPVVSSTPASVTTKAESVAATTFKVHASVAGIKLIDVEVAVGSAPK